MFMWTKISFNLGKIGGNTLNSLGSRPIVVRQAGWQADDILAVLQSFENLSTSILNHFLNGFIVRMAS